MHRMTTTFRQFAISCGKPGPHGLVSCRFFWQRMPYKVVVQAVLLYSSKTWVLLKTALASLEGFHICAAYLMVRRHKRRRGP